MSYPVFLTSSNFAHMPIGSKNQWFDFFRTASFELEANAFIPILWLMLFKQENLLWAKYTDDLDLNDELNQNDLVEYQEIFGDNLYAYLVIEQDHGLKNLEENYTVFIELFGSEYQSVFEQFTLLIQQNYPEYILLRTSGLPSNFNDSSFLIQPLQHIENLKRTTINDDEFSKIMKADLAQFDNHPYFFYGINNSVVAPQYQLKPDAATLNKNIENEVLSQSLLGGAGLVISICTALVVLFTISIWFTTHSLFYSTLVFLISAFALGFISSKLGQLK